MKSLKRIIATLFFGILNRFFFLNAQDETMHVESLEVADSSHMEQDFMADAFVQNSGSGNYAIIIVAALLIIAVTVYFILKKKKKAVT